MGEPVRLQKLLARAGVASRRASEELIREGRVTVDGETVTELGTSVVPDRVRVAVDGRTVERQPARWIALHKPPRYLCTRDDPQGRPTVYDLLPDGPLQDLFHVGRLDFLSEGLLLLSNEGDVAHRVLHPSGGTPRRYEVELVAAPRDLAERMLAGVELEDGPAAADAASLLPAGPESPGPTLLLTLREGRNREIRRMLDALDVNVRRLRRVAFGPVELDGLEPGGWRELSEEEVESLRAIGKERDG